MAHRRSYARRTGAERGFATAKDPATNDISRGWCRLMGLAPLMLFATTLLIVRNQRILAAWNARQEENERRAAAGLPPKTRNAAARPSPASPRRHNPGPSRPRNSTRRARPAAPAPHADSGSMPGNHPGHAESHQADTNRTRHGSARTTPDCAPECQTQT